MCSLSWRRTGAPQVAAIKFEQIEGVKEDAPVIAPVTQPVELRQAIIVASHGLTVDQMP